MSVDAMKQAKTQWCDECRHFDLDLLDATGEGNPCTKGHKPRLYTPRTMSQVINEDWGWKRKCQDFEMKEK